MPARVMAGYFVKMDIDLAESEEVILLSEATGDPIETVIGKLFLFWRWVERHGGALRGVTRLSRLVTLSRVTSCDEHFLNAMIDVGWLALEGDVFVVPGWEKRFSHTAKEKDSTAERQRRCREKKKAKECNGNVTPDRDTQSRKNVTAALPEVEVETEVEPDKKTPCSPPRGTAGKKRHPAFQEFWKAYPRKTGPDAAYRAWKRAGKRIRVEHDLETEGAIARMLEAAQAFAESDLGQDKKFCPHASTWLNGGRYDDDRGEWVRVEESARPGTKDYSLTDFLDGDA